MRGEVDVLDAGVGKAQPGNGETVGQTLVGTHGDFTIEHQAKPLVAAEIVGVALVGQVLVGGGHSAKTESLHLVEGWMCQHGFILSFTDNRTRRGCWCAMAWA